MPGGKVPGSCDELTRRCQSGIHNQTGKQAAGPLHTARHSLWRGGYTAIAAYEENEALTVIAVLEVSEGVLETAPGFYVGKELTAGLAGHQGGTHLRSGVTMAIDLQTGNREMVTAL